MYFIVLMAVPDVLIALKCVRFIYPVTCIGKPNKVEFSLFIHKASDFRIDTCGTEVHSQASRTVLHTPPSEHTGNKLISPLMHSTHPLNVLSVLHVPFHDFTNKLL
jgi:hypothetical protein